MRTKKELLIIFGNQLKILGVNFNIVTKQDLLQIINYRCSHKHTAFTHPNCYRKDSSVGIEKIVCLDIETTNMDADFGIAISWAIKPIGGAVVNDCITLDDIEKDIGDKRVIQTLVEQLRKYTRIVTHYGTYFDISFVRTRAVHWGLDFPAYNEIYHTDVWKIAKRKLKLHSNRQGSVAETILGQNVKTRIHPHIWSKVCFGSSAAKQKALNYVIDHNIKDVVQLEKLYLALRKFVREGRNSI